MPKVTNTTKRLITTHLDEAIPPGVPTEVSDETMNHQTMKDMVTAGFLVVGEPKEEEKKVEDQPTSTFYTGPVDGGPTVSGGTSTVSGGTSTVSGGTSSVSGGTTKA